MKNIIIIGARGMGRTIYNYLVDVRKEDQNICIKGFLDDKSKVLDGYEGYPPIISSVEDYTIKENDLFICSLGDVSEKKKYVELILSKNGEFYTLIHPLANIECNVKIGTGSIIAPYAYIGCDSILGNYCLIQSFAVVGHDCEVGDWSRVDTHATCVGGTIIGQLVTIHTSAVINHKVQVEDNACVGALSFVIKKVKQGITVYGNPARKL